MDITNQDSIKNEILNITKEYYPEIKVTPEKQKIYQVVRKDYDYSNEAWDTIEVVVGSYGKISDAIIEMASLNKTTKEVAKFYVNTIEVTK